MKQEIIPIDRMPEDCNLGDILKIYFERGGFRVGVYRGVSERKPLISNMLGEDENHALCGIYQHDWIIFKEGQRKVFCGETSEGANISGYSILERAVQK